MKVDTLKQLGALYYVLEFVGSGEKSERDVIAYQMSRGMPESTARRNTRSICNGECPLFIVTDSGISVNRQELTEVIAELQKITNDKREEVAATVTKNNLTRVRTSKKELTEEVDALKRQLKDQAELEQEVARLKKLVESYKTDVAKAKLDKPVVLVSSEQVTPCSGEWEHQFLTKEEEVSAVPEEEKSFTCVNYLKRGIKKIFTEKFMKERVGSLLKRDKKKNFKSDKLYVNNLLTVPGLTNQQKLALYATFSEYRHTDFEKLLNFAGDCNINADMLIQWAESLNGEMDFLQLKNALRQFAKPSEYKMKYELAKELLAGEWYVEFEHNGEPTRFRLVSEKDILAVKEALGLSENAFTYVSEADNVRNAVEIAIPKKRMDEQKDVKQAQTIPKPDFVAHYVMGDAEDYDLPMESVSYDEYREFE